MSVDAVICPYCPRPTGVPKAAPPKGPGILLPVVVAAVLLILMFKNSRSSKSPWVSAPGVPAAALEGNTARQIATKKRASKDGPKLEKMFAVVAPQGNFDKLLRDSVAPRESLEEAARGALVPTIVKVPEETLTEAANLSRQAAAASQLRRDELNKTAGIDPGGDEPSVVVPQLIKLLESSNKDERLQAAQELSNIRYAANAETAIDALRTALDDPDREVRDFAKIALDRIAYCAHSALCRSKWRK